MTIYPDYFKLREARMAEYGFTPVRDNGTACPMKLAGRRCTRYKRHSPCICVGVGFLNDHPAMWKRKDGSRFTLWEPYGVDPEALVDLTARAKEFDLRVHVVGFSFWNPGHTVGVLIEANTGGITLLRDVIA